MRSKRPGLTLLELLLVLAIVAILFGIAMPRLLGVARRQELQAAAEQLRTSLMTARTRAMRSGQSQWLLYVPESSYFALSADPSSEIEWSKWEQLQSSLQQRALHSDLEFQDIPVGGPRIDKLPRQVRFLDASSVNNTPMTDPGLAAGTPMAGTGTAGNVSAGNGPILSVENSLQVPAARFAPDGTSRDTVFVLADMEGNQIPIIIRGLTGTAEIGELASPQQPYVGRGLVGVSP